jgi:hypothetical protein
MYDTNFKVKYYDIKQELILKLNAFQTEAGADYCEYSLEDIKVVCDKLYNDELTSVFNAADILDDKIDDGMKWVLDKMLINSNIKTIFDDMKKIVGMQNIDLEEFGLNEDVKVSNEEYICIVVNLILFSEQLFHITHKCICQQLNTGNIDNYLLDQLKEEIKQFFVNKEQVEE